MPEHNSSFTEEGKLTDMAVYFARPPSLSDLTYTDFNKYYRYVTELPRNLESRANCEEIFIHGVNKRVYIKKRSDPSSSIVRMQMLYPSAGEIWYLRVILLNKPCVSYLHAKTFQGTVYETFQLSAIAHGFVESFAETLLCFRDAILFSTAPELRFLFVTLTVQGFPTLQIYNDELCYFKMTEDFHYNPRVFQSSESIKNELLLKLHQLFSEHHCHLSDYSLPEPQEYPNELAVERMKYVPGEQQLVLDTLNDKYPNNHEQEVIFQQIVNSINLNESKKFFLQGQVW
jgi:hypothetical protein